MLKAEWEKRKKDMESLEMLQDLVERVRKAGGSSTRARMNMFTYRSMFPVGPRPVSFRTPHEDIAIEIDPTAPNEEVYID